MIPKYIDLDIVLHNLGTWRDIGGRRMKRYIDSDLINWKTIEVPMLDGLLVRTKALDGVYALKNDVDAIPTADVQEVRHGKWIPISDGDGAECSECGAYLKVSENAGMTAFRQFQKIYKYCPVCGAKVEDNK